MLPDSGNLSSLGSVMANNIGPRAIGGDALRCLLEFELNIGPDHVIPRVFKALDQITSCRAMKTFIPISKRSAWLFDSFKTHMILNNGQ